MTRTATPVPTTTRRELHDGWTVSAVAGPVPAGTVVFDVPATVPGSVHTDLLAAGLIVDPYLDDHERLLAWIGRTDWVYTTRFAWAPDGHERHDLVFDGLDTVAEVRLNGTVVGSTANMHRTYRFDVGPLLVEGENELVVRFAAPVPYADRQSLLLGYRPQVNQHPFNAMRKMACSFGWDWGPDTATSGIWRPVRLESWSVARLAQVRVHASVAEPASTNGAEAAAGRVRVVAEVERSGSGGTGLTLAATVAGVRAQVPTDGDRAEVDVVVPEVDLWWPRTHGDQPLYAVDVELRAGADVLDTSARRVGFRTAALEIEPDDDGTSFRFVVNGVPVWVRGANWIPDDAFPHRVTRERYAARIDQAVSANLNLLRVWGGGIYESDDFYDLCDERGVLTWQDFLFACAAYAEEDPLRSEVEAEVRDNVARLGHHASLVLWNGSNENIWGFHDWSWRQRLDGRTWGLGYYTELLPRVVAELDPDCAYTPSSPWSGSLEVHPNDPRHGSMHEWELWNRQDWPHYRDTVPRFMAEFGWQGPPAWSTLTRAISDDPLTPESPGMLVHQKAMQGNDKLTDGLVAHVPLPDAMEDWHWAMSWNQAIAVRTAIEHYRSWSPRCMGAVVWQLNDCWPVTSWAAVDGDGREKPLLVALRHAFADRLLTVQPRGEAGELVVALVNDSAEGWRGDLVLRRIRYDGVEIEAVKVPVDLAPRTTTTIPVPADVARAQDAAGELLVASLGHESATWFYTEPRDSALSSPALHVEVTSTEDGARVRVTTDTVVRGLSLLADKVHPDAVVDDALVDLLAGESVTFHVTAPTTLDRSALADPRVLRSVNQLVSRRPAVSA
ncbi:glycoside hydrolase family 2 protein [Cellulosimicrobium cellulans]|uniref:glycoside hydrolase family 2 protein n=1 Tax=Cellulosimicrobium cellulans TaxID=1710 RepID=UPI0020969E68|nr:glycoside hydrolase family 2 protein [Cellulosimicrobium cellulans]MCO7274441.1 glycoside hydrolase family 2 protein [Cellulosimicrobium cellulans]